MDCPSEEQLIRLKLAAFEDINALDFDIPNRKLTVFHSGDNKEIFLALESLQLETIVSANEPYDGIEGSFDNNIREKKMLWQVLGINLFFFALELTTGVFSYSMGLIADSLDMLADSIIYGLALWAAYGADTRKKSIAKYAGYFQLMLAFVGFIETMRRFLGLVVFPDYNIMISISLLALLANGICLYLLQKSKSKEVHIQASMIFTSSDVFVNFGIIVAGILVYITQSKYPDIIIGTIVFITVGRGALKILKLSY